MISWQLLKTFCANNMAVGREQDLDMTKPWLHDGMIYASDGHIAVRVAKPLVRPIPCPEMLADKGPQGEGLPWECPQVWILSRKELRRAKKGLLGREKEPTVYLRGRPFDPLRVKLVLGVPKAEYRLQRRKKTPMLYFRTPELEGMLIGTEEVM